MKPISILFAAALGVVALFSAVQTHGAENGASTVPLMTGERRLKSIAFFVTLPI